MAALTIGLAYCLDPLSRNTATFECPEDERLLLLLLMMILLIPLKMCVWEDKVWEPDSRVVENSPSGQARPWCVAGNLPERCG